MKKLLVAAIVWLIMPSSVFAQATMPVVKFVPFSKISSPIIKRSGLYDYQGTSIREDNGHVKVWDCGQESATVGSDAIVYTEFDSQGNTITGPEVVMTGNHGDDLSYDNLHACSPSVVKFSFPQMDPDGASGPIPMGGEYYLMYYECAPLFYNKCDGTPASNNVGNPKGTLVCNPDIKNGQFTQICSAASADGIHWMKYSSDLWNIPNGYKHYGDERTPPTPIVKVAPQLAANCGWDENDFKTTGKMRIYLQNELCTKPDGTNYGVGQMSALVKRVGSGLELWLYYYDSMGNRAARGIYLMKFDDGITPKSIQRINIPISAGVGLVKYYDGQILGHQGIYLGANPIFNSNFFSYSFDGINWVAPDFNAAMLKSGKSILVAMAQPEMQAFNIGKATSNLCPLSGKIGFLGDKYGYLNSLDSLTFFSGEGEIGTDSTCINSAGDVSTTSKLDTWNIYSVTGRLATLTPTPTPTPLPGDIWGPANIPDGHVDMYDFNKMRSNFGNPYTIYNYNDLVGNFNLPAQAGK